MSERGMKKWAPFSSLIEQSICLEKMRYERNKIEKPKISSDQAQKINRAILNSNGSPIKIKYFYDGYLYEIVAQIIRVDSLNKALVTSKGSLPLNNIIDIGIDDYF